MGKKVKIEMEETNVNEYLEFSKILKAFGIFRQNLSKAHNDFVASQLLKTYEIVTKTFVLQGKEYTGTYKEDVRRKYNRDAYEKESKLATVLASFGFDVILIEEDNTLPGKKPDAIVNGIVMDFKEVKAFSEIDATKNTLGNLYQKGMKKAYVKGVVIFLHNFSNEFVINNMEGKTAPSKNGLALFFHEDTGTLQLIDMEKIRTAHIEQSKLAGHPERLPNILNGKENKKSTSTVSITAVCNNNKPQQVQKSSNKKKKNKQNKIEENIHSK